jgi:SAM-dependent methyltransferase
MHRRDPDGVETGAIGRLLDLDGRNVLEVGCGGGRLTTFAASRAASMYAFDPDAGTVEKAAAALPSELRDRVRFAVHDAEALDVERPRFDLALCGWSLWCVPVEGVVHALRRIHAALLPGGLVLDSQPVSPDSQVEPADGGVGRLDMREWRATIDAVDARTAEAIGLGLFAIESEHMITVPDEFDSGAEFIQVVGAWRGTRIPPPGAARARDGRPPVRVLQEVRLRILRALPWQEGA